MKKAFYHFNIKMLPLFIAAVMLFNLSATSFAQLWPKDDEKKIDSFFQQHDYAGEWKKAAADLNEALARVRAIRGAFQPNKDAQAAHKPISKQDFAAQYNDSIDQEYKKAQATFNSEKLKAQTAAGLNDATLPVEQAQALKVQISQWVTDSQKVLNNWRALATSALDKQYKEYADNFNKELTQAQAIQEEELERFVQSLATELMAIHKKYPANEEVKNTLMEVALPVMLLSKNGQSAFSTQDKQLIRKLYVNDIKTNDGCTIETIVKKPASTSMPRGGGGGYANLGRAMNENSASRTEHKQKNPAKCKHLLNSVAAMGLFGEGREDAYFILDFMRDNRETAIAAPSLIYGAGSLIAMGEYGPLRGFVNESIKKEESAGSVIPSLSDIPGMIAYNSLYVGEVSKFTQYPVDGGGKANAWEDMARLLADDNTKESLEILSLAVNCSVMDNGDFTCLGIKPFLLGALLSGKTTLNKNNYKIRRLYSEHSQEFTADGRVRTYTQAEMNTHRTLNNNRQAIFDNMIAKAGTNQAAFLTSWLFKGDMGNVDVDTKLVVDKKLADYYKKVAPAGVPALNMYQKGDAKYNAKKSLRSTVDIFTSIGMFADIAFLVWAFWDIGRLSYNGYRIVSSLTRASKMVRAGASVAQRTTMLRQLGNARTLVKMRRGIGGLKFSAAVVAPNFGARAPVVSADSFITGLPKAFVTQIPKAAAPVVLTDIVATTAGSKFAVPFKRGYQEIFYNFKGIDPYAPAAAQQQSSIFNNAALFAKNGKKLDYSTMSVNDKGELLVDGVMRKVYKISMDQKEFSSFVSIARNQGYSQPVEFKAALAGDRQISLASSPLKWAKNKFMAAKESEYGIKLNVLDNLGNPLNAWLKFDSSYGMSAGMAKAKDITFRSGKFWHEGKPLDLTLGLPKNELVYMVKNGVDFKSLPQVAISYSKSKIGPIYMNMAMSFSAASSGLYFPLTNDPYRSQTQGTMHVPMITVILPYAFSFLSPVAAGFVNKYGAAKTQKLAMIAAAGGLGIAAAAGFNSKIDSDTPPGLWPLYVASGVTGAASALGRASLGVLVNKFDIGNSVLKGMVFKNIGGLAMLIPPAVFSAANVEVDFSVAFPVLGVAALTTVGWMQFVKYPNNINKVEGFRYTLGGIKESYKIMANPSVWPYLAAFTLYSGYEGQALFQNGPGLLKDKLGLSKIKIDKTKDTPEEISDKNKMKNYLAFGSGALLALAPAITRWKAPKNIQNYSPHILRATLSSAAGGMLMYTQDEGLDWRGYTGIALLGYGTANMYGFLQKAMLGKLEKTYHMNPEKFNVIKHGAVVTRTYKQVETEVLTAYTAANMGIAIGPQLTSLYASSLRDKEGNTLSATEANRQSLWIPGLMLAGATTIAAKKGIINLPKLPKGFSNSISAIAHPIGLGYAAYNASKLGSGNLDFNAFMQKRGYNPADFTPQLKMPVLSTPQLYMPPAPLQPVVPVATEALLLK